MIPASACSPRQRPDFVIRDMRDDDWYFACKSWKHTYRHQEEHVPLHIYAPEMTSRIERYKRKGMFFIACDPKDTDYILGWACLGDEVVHYVYVRNMYRECGVATEIIGKRKHVIATHWTDVCEGIAKAKPGCLVYEPSRR